jgi:hypothetical protein
MRNLSTPPHECRGVLLGSPAVAFAFGVNAAQLGAGSGSPSLGRASRSQGTRTVTIRASPATDCSHAPRAGSGVCASSNGRERVVHLVRRLREHGRVFTPGPAPGNPPKRD